MPSKGDVLVSQANELYKRFTDESKEITLDGGATVNVWTGRLVETALDVGIPYGSYGACVKALRYLGSIEILKSGARNNPTVIVLHTEPTEALWGTYSDSAAQALTTRTRSATLAAEAERLIKQLGGLNIGKVLKNFEERITVLEERSTALDEKLGERETNGKTKK